VLTLQNKGAKKIKEAAKHKGEHLAYSPCDEPDAVMVRAVWLRRCYCRSLRRWVDYTNPPIIKKRKTQEKSRDCGFQTGWLWY